MPHKIEEKAKEILKRIIKNLKDSNVKTFDFIVGKRNRYVEVKGKSMSYKKLDFISLTDKQFRAIKKYKYDIYLVCNLKSKKAEIYKLNSKSLLKVPHRRVVSHEWDRSKLNIVKMKRLLIQ